MSHGGKRAVDMQLSTFTVGNWEGLGESLTYEPIDKFPATEQHLDYQAITSH